MLLLLMNYCLKKVRSVKKVCKDDSGYITQLKGVVCVAGQNLSTLKRF